MSRHNFRNDRIAGLDAVSSELPMLDRDEADTVIAPILIAKPPNSWIESNGYTDIEAGDACHSFGVPDGTVHVSDERFSELQKHVLSTVREEYATLIDDIETRIESLDVGMGLLMGEAIMYFSQFKVNDDGPPWGLRNYDLEMYETNEEIETVAVFDTE